MSTCPSILVYGGAPDLIHTRRLVLERSGFQVTVALSRERILYLLVSQRFDVLLLCHSLSRRDCEFALSEASSLRPAMKRLILGASLSACAESERDAVLDDFAAPQTLIARVRDLTDPPARALEQTEDLHA